MRSRFSDPKGSTGQGMDPRELWGVAQKNPPEKHKQGTVRRTEASRARRAAKRAAKMKGVTLKSYLRKAARS